MFCLAAKRDWEKARQPHSGTRCRRQHIDCSQREQISSLSEAKTYRVAKQHIDVPNEAKYAQSKADFINKLEISLKECSETEYWLELIFRKGKMSENTYKDLRNKCGSIRRRLIASITTAKENQNQ